MGDADWWWTHGLDGVIGGVVGAVLASLVTLFAVFLTLRHEEERAKMQALEEAMTVMLEAAIRVNWELREVGPREQVGLVGEVVGASLLAMNRARAVGANVADLIEALIGRAWVASEPLEPSGRGECLSDAEADLIQGLAHKAMIVTTRWLANPSDPTLGSAEAFDASVT